MGLRPRFLPMNIYLQHPIHGRKIATMELEAENDEQNGWTRYNDEVPKVENELVARRKPTRGAAKGI